MSTENFKSPYQELIFYRTYSRWNETLERRETWEETVKRYRDYFANRVTNPTYLPAFDAACDAIRNLDVMPSMRALWTAGRALDVSNVAGYNCAAVTIDSPRIFSEILYVLMCGTGVGFSVERQSVQKLPSIPSTLTTVSDVITVGDSKQGWAEALNTLITSLYGGSIPSVDYSHVRPKGARLRVFGGRASGPEPLRNLFDFVINVFKTAAGRKLTSLECHDICCMIANSVVVGGVRRSACISLSNLSDDRMRNAKVGQFWESHPHRMLANNSVAYTEKPDSATFMQEWLSLMRSGSGERGIFNRQSADMIVSRSGRRQPGYDWLTNP